MCCLLYPYCGRSKTVPSLRSGGKVAYLRPSLLPPPTSRMCAQLTHLCPAAAAAAATAAAAAEIEARAQGRRGRGRIPATASPSVGRGGRGGGGQLDLRRRIKKGKRLFGRAQDIDDGKKKVPPLSLSPEQIHDWRPQQAAKKRAPSYLVVHRVIEFRPPSGPPPLLGFFPFCPSFPPTFLPAAGRGRNLPQVSRRLVVCGFGGSARLS